MRLRDRMLYAGIRTSSKVARLGWLRRDFFIGLILVADDFGRFEADAEELRMVLYVRELAKVSERDVQGMLVELHQAGLIKLYQREGKGYGKVINFRQKLTTRRAEYPDEEGPPPEPELFGGPPTVAPPSLKEGRKEGRQGAKRLVSHAGTPAGAGRQPTTGAKPPSAAWRSPEEYEPDLTCEAPLAR